jgi:RNA polymerase sigma-70 factor (ECF subfamily)
MGETDEALVRRIGRGDGEAYRVLVERHLRRIVAFAGRVLGGPADAEDVAQDVFIRAYRGLRGFKGQAALTTWLYRIAVNVCLNKAAVKTPRSEMLESGDATRAVEPPEAALLRGERAAAVRAAIAQLPKRQRATLILRVYHDLRHDEIATILGSSVGTVKANFFHALANLKKLLK